jgi:hypothetical protein
MILFRNLLVFVFFMLGHTMTWSEIDQHLVRSGSDIAWSVKQNNVDWNTSQSASVMVLKNAKGATRRLDLDFKHMEVVDDGNQFLIVFNHPPDVKGTALLSHTHISRANDTWLYLPALKRVKRIVARDKSRPFMGSELTYEDLSSFEPDKYTFKLLRYETLADMAMAVVEFVPQYNDSGYSRQEVCIDLEHYRMHKIRYFDPHGRLLKVQQLSAYQRYLGTYWRAHHISVHNHQTGKLTVLKTDYFNFNISLSASDFNKSRLYRIR